MHFSFPSDISAWHGEKETRWKEARNFVIILLSLPHVFCEKGGGEKDGSETYGVSADIFCALPAHFCSLSIRSN